MVCVAIPAVGAGAGLWCSPWAVGRAHGTAGARLGLPSPFGSLGCPGQAVAPAGWGVVTRAGCGAVGMGQWGLWHTAGSWAAKVNCSPKTPTSTGDGSVPSLVLKGSGSGYKGRAQVCSGCFTKPNLKSLLCQDWSLERIPLKGPTGRSSEGPWHSRGITLEHSCEF